MAENILEPQYWHQRLIAALRTELHTAVFRCPLDRWRRIEDKHREILRQHIATDTSILDAGCGWGRLINLMPRGWIGSYVGVDISPDFIVLARGFNGNRVGWRDKNFLVGDIRALPSDWTDSFDLAIMVSVRPMVIRNCGQEVWGTMEKELRRCAKKLLYLEYDESDGGTLC